MTTKLTLTVEINVIKRAKIYAKHTGRSLSELVSNHLDMLTSEYSGDEQYSPKLRKIAGVVKLPDDFDEKLELETYLENKHL